MSHTENQKPVVLTIGGLDPSGGAGITLDARAIQLTGCHPATVATILTNQTGKRFIDTTPLQCHTVETTCRLLLEDLNICAIKVGAMGTLDNVAAVDRVIASVNLPVVLDPVLESSSGGQLLSPEALDYLISKLIKKNLIITPNRREAEILSKTTIRSEADLHTAATRILALGVDAVLIKGGHLPGERCIDYLMDQSERIVFGDTRLGQTDVRGTGCALASMIAGGLAHGHPLPRAVAMARNMIRFAIKLNSNIGSGVHVLDLT